MFLQMAVILSTPSMNLLSDHIRLVLCDWLVKYSILYCKIRQEIFTAIQIYSVHFNSHFSK